MCFFPLRCLYILVVDHFEMLPVRGGYKGCRYVTNCFGFFAWSHLKSVRLVDSNCCFSAWREVDSMKQFMTSPFTSVSKSEPLAPIWSRCSLQYVFHMFKNLVSPNWSRRRPQYSFYSSENVVSPLAINLAFCHRSFVLCWWQVSLSFLCVVDM